MAIFKEWLSNKKTLTAQQDKMAAELFKELKRIFAGEFQNISDVAHMPLDQQSETKQVGFPPTKGIRGVVNKLDRAGIFEKAKQISPDFGKRADDVRNMLQSNSDDGQPNPSLNIGKFINLLYGRDNAIHYYESGDWKKNTKVEKPKNQPPMQETPPPEQQPQQPPMEQPQVPEQPPMGQQGQLPPTGTKLF